MEERNAKALLERPRQEEEQNSRKKKETGWLGELKWLNTSEGSIFSSLRASSYRLLFFSVLFLHQARSSFSPSLFFKSLHSMDAQ